MLALGPCRRHVAPWQPAPGAHAPPASAGPLLLDTCQPGRLLNAPSPPPPRPRRPSTWLTTRAARAATAARRCPLTARPRGSPAWHTKSPPSEPPSTRGSPASPWSARRFNRRPGSVPDVQDMARPRTAAASNTTSPARCLSPWHESSAGMSSRSAAPALLACVPAAACAPAGHPKLNSVKPCRAPSAFSHLSTDPTSHPSRPTHVLHDPPHPLHCHFFILPFFASCQATLCHPWSESPGLPDCGSCTSCSPSTSLACPVYTAFSSLLTCTSQSLPHRLPCHVMNGDIQAACCRSAVLVSPQHALRHALRTSCLLQVHVPPHHVRSPLSFLLLL